MLKLVALIHRLIALIDLWQREAKKKELGDATELAITEKDQRIIEEKLGGSADTSSGKYDGMHERPRTKKD